MNKKIFNYLNNFSIELNEDQLLEKLLDRYRWPYLYANHQPSVEAINKDGSKDINLFLDDFYLDSDKTIKKYNQGSTLILSRVEYLNKDILEMHNILSDYIGNSINANIYFGKGDTGVSFPHHNHDYDVFVKNITGSSKWILEDQEIILSDQQALFFSAGTMHSVTKIYKPKISITWNLVKI